MSAFNHNEGTPRQPQATQRIELYRLYSNEDRHPVAHCLVTSWQVLSWLISIVLYILELFVVVWVAYFYGTQNLYVLFGLVLGFTALPRVIIATVSLVWYYNLDRFHRRRKDRDPHNLEFIEYRKKFTIPAVLLHVMFLGIVYRYAQLIYLTVIGKRSNLPYLRRDTALVRFLNGILISTPLIIVHLYALLNALEPDNSYFDPLSPAVLVSLGLCLLSLVYSILTFTTNDHISGKNRRVILPAHILQTLWYICLLGSRILALALFAYAYGFYVFVLIGAHWIVMLLLLLAQRTTFCADIERDEQNSSELKFTRRWCLEFPFNIVASFAYNFVWFNLKPGKTRYWAGFFHLLMLAENVTVSTLFYLEKTDQPYALAGLTTVIGLYPIGVFFMLTFYLLFHPKKTSDWYWIGIPRHISDCCVAGATKHSDTSASTNVIGTGYHNRQSVMISGPTLVGHNGFIPQSMLPAGIPSSPGGEGGTAMATTPAEIVAQSLAARNQPVEVGNANLEHRDHNGVETRPPRNQITSLAIVSPNSTNTNTVRTVTTPSESLPAFSDFNSHSEVDTELNSNLVSDTCNEIIDTVIDTPLFGSTPEVSHRHRTPHGTMFVSDGSETGRADTIDTGIDVESDLQLTQGTGVRSVEGLLGATSAGHIAGDEMSASGSQVLKHEDMTLGINIGFPIFTDIPAKKSNYKSRLEQHYFPESRGQQNSRESVTPTLPTPTWSHSPDSNRVSWGQRASDSGDISSPERTHKAYTSGTSSQSQSQSQTQYHPQGSPERAKRNAAPRSPKGARAFDIHYSANAGDNVSQTQSYQSSQKPVTPRSPKGARRLLVQQSTTSQYSPTTDHHPRVERRYTAPTSSLNKTVQRSPERLPRGAHKQHSNRVASVPSASYSSPQRQRRTIPHHLVLHQTQSAYTQQKPAKRSPERLPRRAANSRHHREEVRSIQSWNEQRSRRDQWSAERKPPSSMGGHETTSMLESSPERSMLGSLGDRHSISSSEKYKRDFRQQQRTYPDHDGVDGTQNRSRAIQSPRKNERQVMDVERNRSFSRPQQPKVNPYFTPYNQQRANKVTAPHNTNTHSPEKTPGTYQSQYNRRSGEFNPHSVTRHSEDFESRSRVSGVSESYPPLPSHTSAAPNTSRYPKAPQGAAANAPKMIRSPPRKRLTSTSPQRSVHSLSMTGPTSTVMNGWTVETVSPMTAAANKHRYSNPLQVETRRQGGEWTRAGNQRAGKSLSAVNPLLRVPPSSAHESIV